MDIEEIEIINQDREQPLQVTHPIVVVLDKLRSAYNVGNIFRLADTCGVERVVTCGYTATPPHKKLEKTALGSEKFVSVEHRDTSLEAVRSLKEKEYFVVGIETVNGSPNLWDIQLQFPVAFVLGNEALGVEKETLAECDAIARLPVYGFKNSLNVANCAAVVLYNAIREYNSNHDGHRNRRLNT